MKSDAFRTDAACVGCGQCVKNCPLNNITLKDRKPVWGKQCTHCMACICYCPTEAIEYGKRVLESRVIILKKYSKSNIDCNHGYCIIRDNIIGSP